MRISSIAGATALLPVAVCIALVLRGENWFAAQAETSQRKRDVSSVRSYVFARTDLWPSASVERAWVERNPAATETATCPADLPEWGDVATKFEDAICVKDDPGDRELLLDIARKAAEPHQLSHEQPELAHTVLDVGAPRSVLVGQCDVQLEALVVDAARAFAELCAQKWKTADYTKCPTMPVPVDYQGGSAWIERAYLIDGWHVVLGIRHGESPELDSIIHLMRSVAIERRGIIGG